MSYPLLLLAKVLFKIRNKRKMKPGTRTTDSALADNFLPVL